VGKAISTPNTWKQSFRAWGWRRTSSMSRLPGGAGWTGLPNAFYVSWLPSGAGYVPDMISRTVPSGPSSQTTGMVPGA
jgi:hypothetical protein